MANLATLSGTELNQMSQREFVDCLQEMSPQAIDRFRKMRKIPDTLNETLDFYLDEHPEKRLIPSLQRETVDAPQAAPAAARPAAQKQPAAPHKKKAAAKTPLQDMLPSGISNLMDGYIPFAERFHAWWTGEEVAPNKRVSVTPSKSDPSNIVAKAPVKNAEEHRIDIMQRVWGEGFERPGGEVAALDVAQSIGTEKGMVVADLAAGLGGRARAIAKVLEVRVVGFESDALMARIGNEMTAARDMTGEVSIRHYDPETASLPERAFDRVIAHEMLYTLPQRAALLESISLSLKGGGMFLFTDFVLTDRSEEPDEVLAWRDSEPDPPLPWTVDEYKESLNEARLDLKAEIDNSKIYVSAVEAAWRHLKSDLAENPLTRDAVDVLMEEGQIWLNRTKALKTGRLRLVQFRTARRKVRTLSDPMQL